MATFDVAPLLRGPRPTGDTRLEVEIEGADAESREPAALEAVAVLLAQLPELVDVAWWGAPGTWRSSHARNYLWLDLVTFCDDGAVEMVIGPADVEPLVARLVLRIDAAGRRSVGLETRAP